MTSVAGGALAAALLAGSLQAQTIEKLASEIDRYAAQEQVKLGLESRILAAERLTVADPVTARRMLDHAIPGLAQIHGSNYLTYRLMISYARIDLDAAEKAGANISDRGWVYNALIDRSRELKDYARSTRLIRQAEHDGHYSLGSINFVIGGMPAATAVAAIRDRVDAFPMSRAGSSEIRALLLAIALRADMDGDLMRSAARKIFEVIDRPDYPKSNPEYEETATFTLGGRQVKTETTYDTILLPSAAYLAAYDPDAFAAREASLPQWRSALREIKPGELRRLPSASTVRVSKITPGPKRDPLPNVLTMGYDEALALAHKLEFPDSYFVLSLIARRKDLTLEQREPLIEERLPLVSKLDPISRYRWAQQLFDEISNYRVDRFFRQGTLVWISALEAAAASDDPLLDHFEHNELHTAFRHLGDLFEQRDFALPQPHPSIAARQLLKDLDAAAAARADFSLKSTEGSEYQLSALKGKVVLIDFWATWCPPCRDALPVIEKLQRELGEKGLIVLGIDDEAPAVVDSFRSKNGITYPTLVDRDRTVHNLFGVDGNGQGIPTTLVFDREGNYLGRIPYPHNEENMRAVLKRAGLE